MLFVLMTVSLLVSQMPTSNGLKCYECVACSGLGSLNTCSDSAKYCQKISALVANVETVSKSCVDTCIEVNTPIVLRTGGGTYCCNTDGCNFGFSLVSSFHLLFLSLISSIFTIFF